MQDAEPWRAAFAGAYQVVWSDPPYDEYFQSEEAEGVLKRSLQIPENLTLIAVRDPGLVVAFGFAAPVQAFPVVAREIRGLLPLENTYYFSELGVLERYRGSKLGRQLVELRLSTLNRQKFHTALLRISARRDHAYEMYLRLGFEDTGVYTEVSSRRSDGATRTDRRVYLSKVL
jgi:GNAT superfamily N-acetyltransferase